MTGSVELDQDGQSLLIRFSYREDLVAAVKELQGRRWDPKGKLWRVPATQVAQVYAVLSRHLFDFAPEIPSLLAGTLGTRQVDSPGPKRPADRQASLPRVGDGTPVAQQGNAPAPALSISGLNAMVRDGLRRQFPDTCWVVGEILDFDKGAGREHRFFQLVEKARGAARALAAVEVALFGSTADRLLPRLASGDAPLTLRDGIEIRALVRIDLYVASGRYQVVIQDIDPSFTLGKLALTREQILQELLQKGIVHRNRSLGFPVPALRIAVLSSPDSEGWNDFLRHLQDSEGGFEVTLLPIKVQGAELRPSLLAGLAWFARHAVDFDVLCIVRGGGSRTDLAWFDDRDIALAVAMHPLKVVIGIGHQRDQSVLDAIAHSEKTPTATAELLVRGVEEARADVRERAQRLHDAVQSHLENRHGVLARRAREVQRAAEQQLGQKHGNLARAGRDLRALLLMRLATERSGLQAVAQSVHHGARRCLDRCTARLEHQLTRHRLLDPRRVLARGYALVRAADGRVLPAVSKLATGQVVRVQFRDGHADGRIESVFPDSP